MTEAVAAARCATFFHCTKSRTNTSCKNATYTKFCVPYDHVGLFSIKLRVKSDIYDTSEQGVQKFSKNIGPTSQLEASYGDLKQVSY